MTALILVDRTDMQIEAIRAGQGLAFSRWGDGEWSCIMGRQGHNKAGMPYSAALRRDLIGVLNSVPTYDIGLAASVILGRNAARRQLAAEVSAWLDSRGAWLKWVDADGLARRSMAGDLHPFIAALATRQVVLVGPNYLRELGLFPVAARVAVPPRMRHEEEIDRLLRETAAALAARPRAVVAISAGMTANVLIDRLRPVYPAAALVDCGSLWEPYTGRICRRYHVAVVAREQARCTLGRA